MSRKSITYVNNGVLEVQKVPNESNPNEITPNEIKNSPLLTKPPPPPRHNYYYYFCEYCELSSIHGIKYLGERGRPIIERIVWVLIIVMLSVVCLVLVLILYKKWSSQTTTVIYSSKSTALWKIPFPAVTICPEAKVDPKIFNYTQVFLKKFSNQYTTIDEDRYFDIFSLICNHPMQSEDLAKSPFISEQTIEKLIKAVPPVPGSINWQGKPLNSSEVISITFTSEGVCATFNMLDTSELLRESTQYFHKTPQNHSKLNRWSIDQGYLDENEEETYPRRAFSAATNAGIEFQAFVHKHFLDKLCGESLQGFKVTLHHPVDFPNMNRHFRLPLDQLVYARIEPQIWRVSEKLKNYEPEKRQCYFPHEKSLRFFKIYSQKNCQLECLTNYTITRCGCVAFYMPRSGTIPICGPGNKFCLQDSRAEYTTQKVQNPYDKPTTNKFEDACKCLPTCDVVDFHFEISQNDFQWRDSFKLMKMLNNTLNVNEKDMYHSYLNVHFKETLFMTSEIHLNYDEIDFFSQVGGILGLLIGISLTSIIEILYFVTLRFACNVKKYGWKFWSGDADMIAQHEAYTFRS